MAAHTIHKDLVGRVFDRLTVIERRDGHDGRSRIRLWACRCSCGNVISVPTSSLTRGNSRSCGCMKREQMLKHGGAARATPQSREYGIWENMRSRCRNVNAPNYHRYGGRGIDICQRWDDFAIFLADMGKCPSGHSLDRINNEGGYRPDNCRWATPRQQMGNKRTNRIWTHDGLTMCATEWARRLGIKPATVSARLFDGWTIERALTTPVRRQ